MNKRGISLLMVVASLLAACAFGYQARGSLSDVPGELRGKGFPGDASGGGSFILADGDSHLHCDGRLSPPETSPGPGSCAGESGMGIVRCNDGREVPVRWTAITCRSFQGSGEDRFGNQLIFRVDRER